MLAERSVIIATTPGTRSLPVTTFCKIPSHALFKLLPIDVSPVAKFDHMLLGSLLAVHSESQQSPQPVDATQGSSLSAGVSNCKVSRGRSFSWRATLFR